MSPCDPAPSAAAPLILLVDDEPRVLRRLEKPLRKAGFRVMTACDGLGALERAAAERPDFVLLDVMMPYMDGFEVLKSWKGNPETASIPVGMLIGKPAMAADYKAVSVRREFYRSDDMELVVIKPLLGDPMELVRALQQWFAGQNRV